MLSYCLKCRKNTESKNPKVVRNKKGRIMLLSNCVCAIVKNRNLLKNKKLVALHKKWSFQLRISSVNVNKSAVNCKFGHICWRKS